jgi:hypothetical protein
LWVFNVWLFISEWSNEMNQLNSQVKVTLRLTVSQSVSLGVEPYLGLMARYLAITIWQLRSCFCGAPSLTRGRVSFVYAAGSSQCSLSRVRVPWDSRPYFTVSDLRLPILSPLTTRTVTDHAENKPLYCLEGVFTAPMHSNRSYSIAPCVLVAAGMCLPSRFLAMNVYSYFALPALGCHVTNRRQKET